MLVSSTEVFPQNLSLSRSTTRSSVININSYALVWTHPLIFGKTGIVHCKHWRLEYQYSQGISSEIINTHFF